LPKLKASRNNYEGLILQSKELGTSRIMIGVPTTGLIRFEWASARYNQVIPCNWSHSDISRIFVNGPHPLGFLVAEARNVLIDNFLKSKFEYLFFIDHDVCLPQDCFVRVNNWIHDYGKDWPVICGLYFAKATTAEPLLYRGRGNSFYANWRLGDVVQVDGIPMGCTLLHRSLLHEMWKDAAEYDIPGAGVVRRVFDTPFGVTYDPEKGLCGYAGTEDMAWCNRVMAGKYLAKAGWTKAAKARYPFLCDTGLFCTHITESGVRYPLTIPKRHKPNGKVRNDVRP
jgi:hypothetical protein